jgi:fluoride ion exporter CrcB/FEX
VAGALAVYFLALAVTQWKFPWPRALVNFVAILIGTALLYLLSGANPTVVRETLRRKERVVGEVGSLGDD